MFDSNILLTKFGSEFWSRVPGVGPGFYSFPDSYRHGRRADSHYHWKIWPQNVYKPPKKIGMLVKEMGYEISAIKQIIKSYEENSRFIQQIRLLARTDPSESKPICPLWCNFRAKCQNSGSLLKSARYKLCLHFTFSGNQTMMILLPGNDNSKLGRKFRLLAIF